MIRRPPRSTLFPYTRSSDLIEIELSQLRFDLDALDAVIVVDVLNLMGQHAGEFVLVGHQIKHAFADIHGSAGKREDRKSTRLNSSHSQISYAVFCLKIQMILE